MATNERIAHTKARDLVATDPATPASGDPLICGQIPGVAIRDKYVAPHPLAGVTPSSLDGQHALPVKAVDGGGNSAVAPGDILYYVSGDTPKLSKKATGVRFGYAAQPITSGSTSTIYVEVGY